MTPSNSIPPDEPKSGPSNFIRDIIVDDLKTGKFQGRVHTRFPPEPNGYLHIGHAKSLWLNFGLASEFGGKTNLRFDDTNPEKEETEYVDSIMEMVHWLGYDWEDRLFYASDYFPQLYAWAVQLIQAGKAYVCDLTAEQVRQYRGTLTEPGRESPYRNRTVEENLELFERMRAGEFPDGSRTLRAKIDMAAANLNLRDPVMYRILHADHHRTGSTWCIYPMYDFAHGQSDSIERITHSICTLEFDRSWGWSWGSGRCSRTRAWRCWRRRWRGRGRHGRRWCGGSGRNGCHCRSRSGGCGSCTSWRARARPITSLRRGGCAGNWTSRRCRQPSTTWSVGTSHSAQYSPTTAAADQHVLEAAAVGPDLEVTGADEESLPQLISQAARHVFDLAREVPLRPRLFRLGEDAHVLVLVTHHIVSDGWSVGVVLRDLAEAYRARLEGGEPRWAELPVQYADYTLRQRSLLVDGREVGGEEAGSALAGQQEYWAAALAGLPEELALPADRPRPPEPSHRGGTVRLALGQVLHAGLLTVARDNGVTLFMVLQAALAVLLTRLGAGTDIPLGSVIAGRSDEALDQVVGFFANTLVLRTDTSGNPTFRELLLRVRDVDLGAYAHQDLPFEWLVEQLNPARSLARHPLFQVMLAFDTTGEATLKLPGLEASSLDGSAEVAKFDLALMLFQLHRADGQADGITGTWEFATDLFNQATIEAMNTRLARAAGDGRRRPGYAHRRDRHPPSTRAPPGCGGEYQPGGRSFSVPAARAILRPSGGVPGSDSPHHRAGTTGHVW